MGISNLGSKSSLLLELSPHHLSNSSGLKLLWSLIFISFTSKSNPSATPVVFPFQIYPQSDYLHHHLLLGLLDIKLDSFLFFFLFFIFKGCTLKVWFNDILSLCKTFVRLQSQIYKMSFLQEVSFLFLSSYYSLSLYVGNYFD